MWDKFKSAALWVWNWITVLVAIILGGLTVIVDYLDQLAGIDLTAIVTAHRAAQITFGVAITKAVVAAYTAQKAKS